MKQIVSIILFTLSLNLVSEAVHPNDSLFYSKSLSRLIIGIDYKAQTRDLLNSSGQLLELSTREKLVHLGWDAATWLNVYGKIGELEGKIQTSGFNTDDLMYTVGATLNLWHMDIEQPYYFSGRYGVQASSEYSMFTIGSAMEEAEWNEILSTLALTAEYFVDDMDREYSVPYSLILYVGVAYSLIDGTHDTGFEQDIEEYTANGLFLGADLFMSYNTSIGLSAWQMENQSYRVALRYHF